MRSSVVAVVVALVLLATGCGGPSSRGAPLEVAAANATSATSVLVTFNAPVGAGAESPSSYHVVAPDGSALAVLDALQLADPTRVLLATDPQRGLAYDLTVTGVAPSAGPGPRRSPTSPKSFTGSRSPAPVVARVVPLSSKKLLVRFGDGVTGAPVAMDDAALRLDRYEVAGLSILSAAFDGGGQDRDAVVLTTAPMAAGSYALAVRAVPAAAGDVLVDPYRAGGTFSGIAPVDTTPPYVAGAHASSTTIVLLFSEPVAAAAADPGRYAVVADGGGAVAVSAATLGVHRTQVQLSVGRLDPGTSYVITASRVTDQAGNAIEQGGAASTTVVGPTSSGAMDTIGPRVTGAASTSPTSVLVTFSEPVQGGPGSAENPEHYGIVASSTAGSGVAQQAIVEVSAATLAVDGRSVVLTTLPQSDIEYRLSVTGVADLAGNLVVPPDRDQPYQATFFGTAASGPGTDSDGDGLTDAAEQRGWTVNVRLADGSTTRRNVTSDPMVADTDGDGVSDRDEKTYLTDPRSADTDADQLTDAWELNYVYSDPASQDSDGDGLADGLEFTFFRTSPTLADTDGDQISDADEINLGNRNPRMADLPRPAIEVGAVDLQLDVRFSAVSQRGSRELETKSVSSTLTQTENQSFGNTDSNTQEFSVKAGVEAQWKVGADFGYRGKFSVETGYTGQWSSSFTQASARETQNAYARSNETQQELNVDESLSREVQGATMKLAVSLKSGGSIAFNIRNLQVTAFVQDEHVPGRLVPIATLVPENEPDGGYNLGPLTPVRGPLVFVDDQVFPALVERLMRDPTGLVFKISNFDLVDEFGRNFAFTSQDINDRTATVVLDYGAADSNGDGQGDATERLKVATSAGRAVFDANGDGTVDDADRILFDASGQQVGITLREALEGVLGLQHFDEDATPSSTLDAVTLQDSYSTRQVGGVERLWRVRGVSKDLANPLKGWVVLTSDGIAAPDQDIGDRILKTEQGITLAFVQDLDDDGVPARVEYQRGCSDALADTDGDGLTDREELYVGWRVSVAGKGDAQGFASCARKDTDGDGLDDPTEKNLGTDATKPDTDGDGLTDAEEVNGFPIDMRFGPDLTGVTTDPLDPDTDGDTLPDGAERDLGTDPNVNDGDKVFDDDGDGLVNFQEDTGWTVQVHGVSTTPYAQGPASSRAVTSDKSLADTDGDGLNDLQESQLGTDPRAADTDQDGVNDAAEIADGTDPLDADTDNDLRSDGAEKGTPILVQVVGQNAYQVSSDPFVADVDLDGWADGEEAVAGTDPTKYDTDGDGGGVSDSQEAQICAGAGDCRDPLRPDQKVTLTFNLNVNLDGDLDVAGGSGDFVHTLTVSRSGTTALSKSGTAYANNNSVTNLWTPVFIKPVSQSIQIDIVVYESDSGTSTDGVKCRLDYSGTTLFGSVDATKSFSTPTVDDFVGDPIAECKFGMDVTFGVE